MKNLGFFVGSLILVLAFSAAAFAQNEKLLAAKGKVAIINTSIWDDADRGIKKFAEAVESVYSEDKSVTASFEIQRKNFETQRKDLQKEIDSLIAQNKSINEAYAKLNNLVSEFTRTLNRRNTEINTKYKSTVLPVYEEIKKKAKEFAELKGYSIIIDKSEIGFLVEGEMDDITTEFIKYCNESFDKEKSTDK